MLNYEEKKAIEEIKLFNQYNWEMNNLKLKEFAKPYFESLDTVLNLIEKQAKEIEELNKSDTSKEQSSMKYYSLYKGLVDKIKAKIEELANMTLVEIEEKVERHTFYLSLEGLSEGKKVASYFLQSLLEKE